MIVLIDSKNAQAFQNYIPEFLYARLADPNVFLLGAVTDDRIAAGAISGCCTAEGFTLMWMMTGAPWRRQGFMTELLDRLLTLLPAYTTISCEFEPEDSPEAAVFLKKRGFRAAPEPTAMYHLPLKTILETPFFQSSRQQPRSKDVLNLDIVPDYLLDEFIRAVSRSDRPLVFPLPLRKTDYSARLSLAHVSNRAVDALLLFKVLDEDAILLCAAQILQGIGSFPLLLHTSSNIARRLFPPETIFYVAAANEVSDGLIRRLMPGSADPDNLRLIYTKGA